MLQYHRTVEAFCTYPFQRIKVTSEGDVTMSCFQEKKCLGNILKKDVQQIWDSALANQIREFTEQGKLHPTCQVSSCPHYNSNNRKPITVSYCPHPVELEIDLPSQHCNIGKENPTKKNPACIMCERHRLNNFHQEDRLEEICEILRPHMRNIRQLHIQGIAEPFWKGKIFELLDWLNFNKDRCSITTTTNGTLMNKATRDKFLSYPSSTLTWSLDAGSPEVFKAIRRLNAYSTVVRNLKAYANEREPSQKVHIHNNINTINICDVMKMVELAAEANVDRLDFNPSYYVPAIEVNPSNAHIFRDAQERIIERAEELNVNVTFMRPFVPCTDGS